ncbi:hypothetical protein NEILACOT_03246 [Neisseria lactamica ATCC 23970]|uniref:Uncharacterized protein n=1 Tax=Neisseria lactamica ATCC 23970 TaxID=546265 RepID=D0W6V5_NEILA|nr:hypothetical protein NEILACOT_03246 [Neisseria lactamica ATCC 23970]
MCGSGQAHGQRKNSVSDYLIRCFFYTADMGKKRILLKIHRIYTFS